MHHFYDLTSRVRVDILVNRRRCTCEILPITCPFHSAVLAKSFTVILGIGVMSECTGAGKVICPGLSDVRQLRIVDQRLHLVALAIDVHRLYGFSNELRVVCG